MNLDLAKHIQNLMNELEDVEALRHGIYKAMLPEETVKQRVAEYDARIEEIKKELEIL